MPGAGADVEHAPVLREHLRGARVRGDVALERRVEAALAGGDPLARGRLAGPERLAWVVTSPLELARPQDPRPVEHQPRAHQQGLAPVHDRRLERHR